MHKQGSCCLQTKQSTETIASRRRSRRSGSINDASIDLTSKERIRQILGHGNSIRYPAGSQLVCLTCHPVEHHFGARCSCSITLGVFLPLSTLCTLPLYTLTGSATCLWIGLRMSHWVPRPLRMYELPDLSKPPHLARANAARLHAAHRARRQIFQAIRRAKTACSIRSRFKM